PAACRTGQAVRSRRRRPTPPPARSSPTRWGANGMACSDVRLCPVNGIACRPMGGNSLWEPQKILTASRRAEPSRSIGGLALHEGGDDVLLRELDRAIGRRQMVAGVRVGVLHRQIIDQRDAKVLPFRRTDALDIG